MDILKVVAIVASGILLVGLASAGLAGIVNSAETKRYKVEIIDLGDHKYVLVTSAHGVAICPVP